MAQSVESFRATVAPHQCDHLGHMNVQHYFAAVSDGMFALMNQIGLSRGEIERRRIAFAVVQADSGFRQELVAGDVISLRSTVEAVGGKSATFRHRLFRADNDTLAFETVFKCVLLHLDNRASVEVPDDLRDALETLRKVEAID